MNLDKLKIAEQNFLLRYPGGFQDPEMLAIAKKHRMDKMVAFADSSFGESQFSNGEELSEKFIKMVTSSSMVSVFEKPRTRDFIRSLNSNDRDHLTNSLYEMLYLDEEKGFNGMLDVLSMGKLAKWTLMTVVPAYLRPQKDVFVKPTTAKGILKTLEVNDIVYRPRPYYEFYKAYRDFINEIKTYVDSSLSPSNAAFSGFLMMTQEG